MDPSNSPWGHSEFTPSHRRRWPIADPNPLPSLKDSPEMFFRVRCTYPRNHGHTIRMIVQRNQGWHVLLKTSIAADYIRTGALRISQDAPIA
jgi:hypothetical protein